LFPRCDHTLGAMWKAQPGAKALALLALLGTFLVDQTHAAACDSNPCQNLATCTESGTDYTCTCRHGWTGTKCESSYACLSNPCDNGGTCTDSADKLTWSCACDTNWNNAAGAPMGCTLWEACKQASPCPCAGTNLANNYCDGDANTKTCNYHPANDPLYFHCKADACVSSPCANGGVCTTSGTDDELYTCTCADSGPNSFYSGTNCDQYTPYIENPCMNNGTSSGLDANGNWACDCTADYIGNQCQTANTPCNVTPCLNGGFCVDSVDLTSRECKCGSLYQGTDCEQYIPCESNPCLNTATCTNRNSDDSAAGFDIYKCACQSVPKTVPVVYTATYSGLECEQEVACSSSPCMNAGTCSNGVGGPNNAADGMYTCACSFGFFGTRCENEYACLSNPCENGGTCSHPTADPSFSTFACACTEKYDEGDPVRCSIIDYCDPNPCPAHSNVCSPNANEDGYVCGCASGYSGDTCDVFVACDSNPCLNGGLCQNTNNNADYTCGCSGYYQGTQCETHLPCSSNPCAAGSTCVASNGDWSCNCPATTTGPECDVQIKCSSTPCQNNGVCTDWDDNHANPWDGYTCECSFGWYNSLSAHGDCDMQYPCATNPCLNGGTCTNSVDLTSYVCECVTGYAGLTCATHSACDANPCGASETCNPTSATTFECTCNTGYTGAACDEFQACLSTPCKHGGYCTNSNNNADWSCSCGHHYTTDDCDKFVPCSSNPCVNGGVCGNSGDYASFSCTCDAAYNGVTCETSIPCAAAPCLNGGICTNAADFSTYTCACAFGFSGNDCESMVPCFAAPCKNGGDCTNIALTGYTCVCTGPWTGADCDVYTHCNPNPCGSESCAPNQALDGYECFCSTPGYTGANCDIFEPCLTTPCQNGGICENTGTGPTDYTCTCFTGFTGSDCELNIPCFASPCINGGTCSNSNDWLTYTCACLPENAGVNCENSYPCDAGPCQNDGVCTNSNDLQNYSCACNFGFTGSDCENTFPCKSNPCKNNASCRDDLAQNKYTCNCPYQGGWAGDTCETFSSCTSAPCKNGGTCNPVENNATDFTCSCTAEYTNTNSLSFCETLITCSSNPCLNGGVCVNSDDFASYTCNCAEDYTGVECASLIPSVFPAIYDNVFNDADNAKYIEDISIAKQGIKAIKNAINKELTKTVDCLESLNTTQKRKVCMDKCDELVKVKPVAPFIHMGIHNFFYPFTAKRALSKSLFDMSFMYLEKFGFHERVPECITECAILQCPTESAEIRTELQRALGNFSPASKGGSKSAGRHPQLDWAHLVKAYDGEASYQPLDGYNIFALQDSDEDGFHTMTFPTGVLQDDAVAPLLNKQQQSSWFIGTQLAAVHDFHYWSLFMTSTDKTRTGLFDLTSALAEDAFLTKIVENTKFNSGTKYASIEKLKGGIHTEGKKWMVGSGQVTHFKSLLPTILGGATPNPYLTFMQELSADDSTLLATLGYNELPADQKAAIKLRIKTTVRVLVAMRRLFYFMELRYLGHLIKLSLFLAIVAGLFLTCCCCCCCCTCCQILPCCYRTKVITKKILKTDGGERPRTSGGE